LPILAAVLILSASKSGGTDRIELAKIRPRRRPVRPPVRVCMLGLAKYRPPFERAAGRTARHAPHVKAVPVRPRYEASLY